VDPAGVSLIQSSLPCHEVKAQQALTIQLTAQAGERQLLAVGLCLLPLSTCLGLTKLLLLLGCLSPCLLTWLLAWLLVLLVLAGAVSVLLIQQVALQLLVQQGLLLVLLHQIDAPIQEGLHRLPCRAVHQVTRG
jgi:hypothetical protein